MSEFNGRVFLCSNCGQEVDWYEQCSNCEYEPDNNGQYD